MAASSRLSCPESAPTSGVAIVPSSQSVARCQADTRALRTTSRPVLDFRIPDDDVQHKWGRQIAASGDHRRARLESAGNPPLLGKSRARLFVQPGHGGRGRVEGFVGRSDDGIGLDQRQIVHEDLNHRPAKLSPSRYISWASSDRFNRSRTRPRR